MASDFDEHRVTEDRSVLSIAREHTDPDIYDDGYLRVEHDNHYVSLNGHSLKLPRKEFLIISRLARNPERVVAAEEIWQHGWGQRATLNAASLHVHIYRLRRRLEPFGLHIETTVNVGYRLVLVAPCNGATVNR